jgi:hypothetical protein
MLTLDTPTQQLMLSNALSDAADAIFNWPDIDLFPTVGIPTFHSSSQP